MKNETLLCHVCGKNHEDQRALFRKGMRVKAITPLAMPVGYPPIPAGAGGVVSDHCDDGRAYVYFDGHPGGHTFHSIREMIAPLSIHDDPEAMAAVKILSRFHVNDVVAALSA